MDLPENWEKMALIGVAAVLIISVIYALNPFPLTAPNDTMEQTTTTTNIIPFPKITKVNNNTSDNSTIEITLERAKTIAAQQRPGYTVGNPVKGSVVVNNTTYPVWIVPLLTQNTVSKTIYIDLYTGNIVFEI
jgi:hypothetical protein